MMEWLWIPLLAGLALAAVLLRRRAAREQAAVEFDEAVEYTGALRVVLDGGYPEFLKLLPPLPGRGRGRSPSPEKSPEKVRPEKKSSKSDPGDFTRLSTDADREAAEDNVERTKTWKLLKRQGPDPTIESETATTSAFVKDRDVLLPEEIFGSYDIRGEFGRNLNAETAYYLGRALGGLARERGQERLAVARDARLSSTELAQSLAKGLRASGVHVINIGIIPTPVYYLGMRLLQLGSGVMVTGSHLSASYNGFKIQLADRPLWGDALASLRDRIRDKQYPDGDGNLHGAQVSAEYVKRVIQTCERLAGGAGPAAPLKLVLDGTNAIGGKFAAHLLGQRGFEVMELYCDLDGLFPNHPPDPTQPENLAALIEQVRAEQAAFGFALDGDADRLVLVDEQGSIVWPDRVLMLLAGDVLSRHPGGKVIYDVKCTHHLGRHVESLGGEPLMWKTGHSLIKEKILDENAVLAGEMSGHLYFCRDWYPFDDGLFAAVRIAELLHAAGCPVSELFAALPGGMAGPEHRVPMPREEVSGFMQRFSAEAAFTGAERIELDGLRVQFPDRWGLVRPSNTEPCLVFRFEGDDAAALAKVQEEFRWCCEQVAPDLKVPF